MAVEGAGVVFDEEGGAAVPGAEVGPGCFCPALLCEGPVDFAWCEAEPVFSGDRGGERVGDVVVEDHLWGAGCARCEVYHGGICGPGRRRGVHCIFGDDAQCGGERYEDVVTAVRFAVDLEDDRYEGAFFADTGKLGQAAAVSNDGCGAGCLAAEFDIMFDEEHGRWTDDDAHAERGRGDFPPWVMFRIEGKRSK